MLQPSFSCMFVSDLHGSVRKFLALFKSIEEHSPSAVFIGGDILPSSFRLMADSRYSTTEFLSEFLAPRLEVMRDRMKDQTPRVLMILGNDDGRADESLVGEIASHGLWEYIHMKSVDVMGFPAFGYSFVPPSPFLLKDWERYDVSRYVDPDCISPEEGVRTAPMPRDEMKFSTIQRDLRDLTQELELDHSIVMFHTPPYQTKLDTCANTGKFVDGVPLDPHIGSIAVRRFIENRQPLLTLHGHVHESTRLTGSWRDEIGKTVMFSAAHDGPELAIVHFDLMHLDQATRELVMPA